MRTVKNLDLRTTAVTDAGLVHVVKFKDLEFLNLAATKVADQGVATMRNMPSLKALFLGFTPITDDAVEALCDMPSLEYVDLTGTCVSEKAIRKLQSRIRRRCGRSTSADEDASDQGVRWMPMRSETERDIAADLARKGTELDRSILFGATEHPPCVLLILHGGRVLWYRG